MSTFISITGNGLSIIPQFIEMIPGDRQGFRLRGAKIPALFKDGVDVEVQPDYTATAAGDSSVDLLYRLETETGEVTVVFDERNLDGQTVLRIQNGMLTDIASLSADSGGLEVIFNGDSVFTDAHVIVAGDRLGWEITGTHFHAKLNGDRVFSAALTADAERYPVTVTLLAIGVTDYTYVPPILQGDWRVLSATWEVTPDDGDLASVASGETPPIIGSEVSYTAPNVPSTYTLTAVVFDNDYATATARVIVPTFRILGKRKYLVDPEDTIRVRTNYDRAQRDDLLEYDATGGTFSEFVKGLYEAPNEPGDYVITVTATFEGLLQTDQIFVTVRKVFFPRNLCAVEAGEVIELETNMEDPVWTTTGGEITGTGQVVSLEAPENLGQGFRVSVTDGTDTLFQDLTVLERMPIEPATPYEERVGAKMLIETARDGFTRWGRQITKPGFIPEIWDGMLVTTLDGDEYTDPDDGFKYFHDRHWTTGQAFFIIDEAQQRRVVVKFTTELKVQILAACSYQVSFGVVKSGCPLR